VVFRAKFTGIVCLGIAAPLASACGQSPSSDAVRDAGAGDGGAPLEAAPPAIVAPGQRANASSSPVVFDPVRGAVWTANGDVGTVSLVDVDARRVIEEIAIGGDIRSVALSPDGAWIAAVDRSGASVTLLDAETHRARRTIALGTHPRACLWDAANPRWLYVAVEDDGQVAVVDRTLGAVAATIDVGRLPSGLAVTRSRRELYVAHRIDAAITVVDLRYRTAAADVPLADEPFTDLTTPNGKPFGFESMAITADGSHAWVPHELLAPTHPFVFNQTLFPAISVVDLVNRAEEQTDPNDPAGAIAGRKNLFDAIKILAPNGQPAVVSQICAAAIHPNGSVGWAIACGSEDLLTFAMVSGAATDLLRNLPGDHPVGLALDDTGQRLFVLSDQSHTLATLDTGNGSVIRHTTLFGDPIPLVATDPVDPDLRAGLTLFFRANASKGTLATTGNDWMSCGGCHLDGFQSNNARFFEALVARDPQSDAQIGHVGLRDHFATANDSAFDPHDVLLALLDQGGLTADRTGANIDPSIPDQPTAVQAQMAQELARVIARDLPQGPTWLRASADKPNTAWDTAYCGGCHRTEYAAWQQSVHAHAAEDVMFQHGLQVERDRVGAAGTEFVRLCAGCHDPVTTRAGDGVPRGVTCLGCHDVTREIRAGGNGDLEATAHDWGVDHKTWGLASLDKLRQPEFCGGCHQQFVPGTALVAISTLDEFHASPYAGASRCVDCHMAKDANGFADHHFPGGNVYLSTHFNDADLSREQMQRLSGALTIDAKAVSGGVLVTVHNGGVGHGFPTGVTDLREAWVELQAMDGMDANAQVLAHIGGPGPDGVLAPTAARLGIDIAKADGTILYEHELTEATRFPFDLRVPSGEAQALFVPLPATLPAGTVRLDAVLYLRNVRTTYYRAATGDANGVAPTVPMARTSVPLP
jgi:DNA-binding beta-propeller fold protein YncE